MPKSYKWFEASFAKGLNNAAIVFNFFFVKFSLFGLDARPFNRKSMRVVPK